MNFQMEGRSVLVKGASKGIGAGIAEAFGKAGASVAVGFGSDREGAERVAAEINNTGGRPIQVQATSGRQLHQIRMAAFIG